MKLNDVTLKFEPGKGKKVREALGISEEVFRQIVEESKNLVEMLVKTDTRSEVIRKVRDFLLSTDYSLDVKAAIIGLTLTGMAETSAKLFVTTLLGGGDSA